MRSTATVAMIYSRADRFRPTTLLLALTIVSGCASAAPQAASRSGAAQGAVDILLAGQKITEQYSIHVTSCQYDAAAHELTFSGKEMAALAFKTQDALRISEPGIPLRVTAYRKGQPLAFNPAACQNQSSKGEVNLNCRSNGNRLSVTLHYTQCGTQ